MPQNGFITYLKAEQPGVWALLLNAQQEGLITIDEEVDAVTATDRLLWTYPGLHEVLIRIINGWAEDHAAKSFQLTDLLSASQSKVME